jgi:tetratricopeptide (TPR) repeat protein
MLKKFAAMIIAGVIGVAIFTSCQNASKPAVDGDKLREYAGDLINRSLYTQAIDVYSDYLASYNINDDERANVNYIIGNTFFDRLHDYESALAYYLKIKHLYPESSLINETNKKVVACLERLERSEDAQQALDESVQMNPDAKPKKRPGAVVARIGKREITQGDLDFELSQLPPSVRDQFSAKEKKLSFLREFVATELLYDTAKRAGLDKDTEVIEAAFQAKKSYMVQKLLQERVAAKAQIEADDLQLFWEANKDDYAEKDDEGNVVQEASLDQVREQVLRDLSRRKQQNAYEGLIEKMILAEDVKFYEGRLQ